MAKAKTNTIGWLAETLSSEIEEHGVTEEDIICELVDQGHRPLIMKMIDEVIGQRLRASQRA
jgi:hypothetical protein